MLVLAVALLLPHQSAALSIFFNGEALADAELLRRRSAPHVVGDEIVTGVSLGEVLPLLFEFRGARLEHAEGSTVFPQGFGADELFRTVLLQDGRQWHLSVRDELLRDVSSLRVRGVPLDTDELTLWLSWEGTDVIKEEIGRFAELFDIDVSSSTIPNTQSKLTATERARGTPADVALIQSSYIPDLLEFDALQPLGTVSAEGASSERSGRTAGAEGRSPAIQAFASQGRLWAGSLYFDSHLVFYNPELVEGPIPHEWTLADLERRARRLRGDVEAPVTWNAYSAYWLTPFILGFGKDAIVGSDGQVHVDNEPTRRAIEYILDLMEEETLTVMERDAMTAFFTSGRAGFILTGSYSIPAFERLGIPFEVAPYPIVDETRRPLRPFLDFKGFAVARRARHPALARRFIAYMTSPAVQARVTLPIRKMPADRAAWPLVVEDHPYADALIRSYEIGVPVPNERGYTVYKSLMWRMLRFVFNEQMTVDQMLSRSEQMLSEAGSR
jgi:ABC-type glycerol-3-phosphate transport system substrate-binding protein